MKSLYEKRAKYGVNRQIFGKADLEMWPLYGTILAIIVCAGYILQ